MPAEQDTAPEFELPADDGSTVRLSDLRGRKVVVYFYPRDDTPGCTRQACSLRDRSADLESRGAVVLGVSPDSVASHQRFRQKHGLPFPLLADTRHEVATRYGVWTRKTNYGRTYWGNERTTFVIDEEGRITRIIRGVRPEEHVVRALEVL